MRRALSSLAALLALAAFPAFAADAAPQKERLEWKLLPVAGGNTDIGVLLGTLGVASELSADPSIPYRWQLLGQLALSFKLGPGGLYLPIQDHFANFDWIDVPGRHVRLLFAAEYASAINAGYYGLGNASQAGPWRAHQYKGQLADLSAVVRWNDFGRLHPIAGLLGRFASPTPYPGSRLEADVLAREPLLIGVGPHLLGQLSLGVEWDGRDEQIDPHRGIWAAMALRGTPSFLTQLDKSWGAASLVVRTYHPFLGEDLIVAFRAVGDVLAGEPPIEELSRAGAFQNLWYLGGSTGVRGVPEGRFQGKLRAIANLELRAMPIHFRIWGERGDLGAVVFFDAGRVRADWRPRPDLDGRGFRLHYGTGGGARFRWGEAFVVRLDVAYSPDAAIDGGLPLGIYLDVGQLF